MNNPVVVERELLPCPFCGGDPNPTHDDYVHDDLRPMPVIECKSCSAWVRAEDWNRRAQPAEAEGVSALDELLALYPFKIDKQAFVVNGGAPLTADGDDEFLSFKKVDAALDQIRRLAEHARAALSAVTAERDRLMGEIEQFKFANRDLSEINAARRRHLNNAKKAAGIDLGDDLVGAIQALRLAVRPIADEDDSPLESVEGRGDGNKGDSRD